MPIDGFDNVDDLVAEIELAYIGNNLQPVSLDIIDHGDAGRASMGGRQMAPPGPGRRYSLQILKTLE